MSYMLNLAFYWIIGFKYLYPISSIKSGKFVFCLPICIKRSYNDLNGLSKIANDI